jgi:glycosyltransferase involved in cell wall biosynthesis
MVRMPTEESTGEVGDLGDSPANGRHPLAYVLHSSEMYGTERMALAMAQELAGQFNTIFIGPRGPAMWEAQRLGFETRYFQSTKGLIQTIRPLLQTYPSLTLASTLPRFTLVCMALNVIYRRRIRHVFVIHGSGEEQKDFGRIRYLNPLDITIVAVSQYVKRRLIEHGCRADRIEVAPNFLPPEQIAAAAKRGKFTGGVKRAISVGRLAQAKRLDLLLEAVDCRPELADFPIDIAGEGELLESLRRRAEAKTPNVHFLGFVHDVPKRYARSDLLIHPCPTEAFGLVVIEAMAARIPVLVADEGGPATFVEEGVTGFKYRGNDPRDLARRLVELRDADPQVLNRVTDNAAQLLQTRLSAAASLDVYRRAFAPVDSV